MPVKAWFSVYLLSKKRQSFHFELIPIQIFLSISCFLQFSYIYKHTRILQTSKYFLIWITGILVEKNQAYCIHCLRDENVQNRWLLCMTSKATKRRYFIKMLETAYCSVLSRSHSKQFHTLLSSIVFRVFFRVFIFIVQNDFISVSTPSIVSLFTLWPKLINK